MSGSGAGAEQPGSGSAEARMWGSPRSRAGTLSLRERVEVENTYYRSLQDVEAWVAQLTKDFKEQRVRPGGIGEARKYLLREMMATAPSLGHRKLSTLMYLANLHCAVAMGQEEGHVPDESEMRLIAEAARAMTVSPSTFQEPTLKI